MPLLKRENLHPEAIHMLESLRIKNDYPPFSNDRASQYMDENAERLKNDAFELADMIEHQLAKS